MGLPAVPEPDTTPVPALVERCLAIRAWVDSCNDLDEALEVHRGLAAIEEYLSKRGNEGPAQEAARWLEVRIGELLGPAETGKHINGDDRVTRELPKPRRYEFRRMAEHRDVVAELVPTSRRRILKVIRQRDATVDTPAEPLQGVYPTIVIDPPWQYENTATRGAAEDHYSTMTLTELAALKLPAADNAHLYLWTTNAFIRPAFELLDAWGFAYKTMLTWTKSGIGTGNYFRNNTEHILFAVRGNLPVTARNVGTWFTAKKGRHSAKPECFYDIVERCSPGPHMEMFARRRRFGWATWGNEA